MELPLKTNNYYEKFISNSNRISTLKIHKESTKCQRYSEKPPKAACRKHLTILLFLKSQESKFLSNSQIL